MGKKKRWFTYMKKLFNRESKPKSEESLKKPKNWSWFLEKFKFNQYPALEAPHERTLNDATEEHRMQALTVAIATAAAAEAAVAAANAAAEVVRLSHKPYKLERETRYLAAIKIQSTYRGHLARKALSALKGIVKLQAVVRGQLVRNNIVKRLASMALLLKPKPEVQQERVLTLVDYLKSCEKRHSFSRKQSIKSEELQLQCYSLRDWDFNMVSNEGSETFHLRKQEAVAKRERMKQYSISNRDQRSVQSLQEQISHKGSTKINRADQFKELEVHQHEGTKLKLRTTLKQEIAENLHSSYSLPRRSLCHIKQKSIGDDGSLPSSPVFPPYMAATESAKAKCRSLSTPRQRFRLFETYSGPNSPHKISLSGWSSFNGDSTNSSKRNSISKQTSTLQ